MQNFGVVCSATVAIVSRLMRALCSLVALHTCFNCAITHTHEMSMLQRSASLHCLQVRQTMRVERLQEAQLHSREQELAAISAQFTELEEGRAAAERATLSLLPLNLTVSELRQRLAKTQRELALARVRVDSCDTANVLNM